MPIVQTRRRLPHFVGIHFLSRRLTALSFSPFPKLDLVVDVTQTAALQISAGSKIRRHLGTCLSGLTLEQRSKASLSTSNRRAGSDLDKWKANMANEQTRTGPSRAIGDELEKPICGVCPQGMFAILVDDKVFIVE